MAFIFPFHLRVNSVLCQTKISRKMPKILQILRNPGSKDSSGFLPIFMWLKAFHQRNSLSYKTLQRGQSGAMLRSTLDHHVLPALTFKDKTPQGMEHVWLQCLNHIITCFHQEALLFCHVSCKKDELPMNRYFSSCEFPLTISLSYAHWSITFKTGCKMVGEEKYRTVSSKVRASRVFHNDC